MFKNIRIEINVRLISIYIMYAFIPYIYLLKINNMNYCIDPSADEPILLINKHIGFDTESGQGIDGAIFQQELLYLDTLGKKRIQVWINSAGGVVMDGYSIYSTILKTKTPVDTYAVGGVASIAAVIFQAGRKRIMTDYAWLMYHNPFGGDDKDMIKTMKDSLIKMIEQRSGMSEAEITLMLNRSTFILADEAKSMKLCDQVDLSKDENSKWLKKISNEMPVPEFHNECNKVLNSIINQTTTKMSEIIDMKLVCNRLGLNPSAPEESILKAIDAIENRAKKAETETEDLKKEKVEDKVKNDDEMDKLKAKLKKAEEDKSKADKEYEDCKSQLDAIMKDKEKAEEDAKKDKIKNMVEDFAKVGRIKNTEEVKLQWRTTGEKIGFDEAKNLIELLPLNKESVKIETVLNKVEHATSAESLREQNRKERNK